MKTKQNNRYVFNMIISSVLTGFIMWVVGGLYHNLILPSVNQNMHPHHEGLGITLIAYILLGFFMNYFYVNSLENKNSLAKGIKIGVLVGILWVFPHGLTMAAVHESSILYQITNTLYHILEQGIGGVMIFISLKYILKYYPN